MFFVVEKWETIKKEMPPSKVESQILGDNFNAAWKKLNYQHLKKLMIFRFASWNDTLNIKFLFPRIINVKTGFKLF